MVQDQQDIGLDKLRLDGGRTHRQDRLLREDGRTLRHGVDVAREAEALQIPQKALVEQLASAQIFDVLGGEVQILDILDDLLQTGRDGEAAVVRHVAVKDVKIADLILHPADEVAVAHGQLVKIAEHGHIQRFVDFHIAPRIFAEYLHGFRADSLIIAVFSGNGNLFFSLTFRWRSL